MTDAAPVDGLTHRRVLHIAAPIVLSNATVPILGMVDTGVVGQMGDPVPIGAVGIGAIILSAVYWVFGFLRMGTTGLVGQARGAGDSAESAALLLRAIMIAGLAGVALIVLQRPIFAGAFMVSPASPAVEALARDYMSIRIWSAPAAIAVFGMTGWLIAQERTRAVLLIQLAMNGMNIGLDLLFVPGFGWGVQGVAAATFIAEWSGAGIGLWLCRDAFSVTGSRDPTRLFDKHALLRMAAVNSDILIRSLLLQGIFVSFLFLGAKFDDVTLAANQVLLQFLHVTAYAMDGFAFAAEALVAQAYGARKPGALRRASAMTSVWGVGAGLLLGLVFALAGPRLIDLMTNAEAVRSDARLYLPWMIVAPIAGSAAFMLDGIFIGATRTADMRNMMVVSAVVYCVALTIGVPALGNHGLWLALIISLLTRGVTLGLRYPSLEKSART